jgi:hypothetical protein
MDVERGEFKYSEGLMNSIVGLKKVLVLPGEVIHLQQFVHSPIERIHLQSFTVGGESYPYIELLVYIIELFEGVGLQWRTQKQYDGVHCTLLSDQLFEVEVTVRR